MVVRNARLTGMFLVVDEPNLGLRLVMLREPGAPFLPAGYIQRLAYFHFVVSAAVEDNDRRRTSAVSRVRLRTSTAAHCWASCHRSTTYRVSPGTHDRGRPKNKM